MGSPPVIVIVEGWLLTFAATIATALVSSPGGVLQSDGLCQNRGRLMEGEIRRIDTSQSSPGQVQRRERLLRIYDELDDAGKRELLDFAVGCALRSGQSRIPARVAAEMAPYGVMAGPESNSPRATALNADAVRTAVDASGTPVGKRACAR